MNIYQSFYQKKLFSLLFIMTSDAVMAQLFDLNNRDYFKKKSYFVIDKNHTIAVVNE